MRRQFGFCAVSMLLFFCPLCFAQDAPAANLLKPGLTIFVHDYADVPTKLAPIAVDKPNAPATESAQTNTEPAAESYMVFGATPAQEAALRAQIQVMHPDVQPLRVFFLPHWKYLAAARDFHLRVPVGYGSLMFTHLPGRTVFIDNDRCQGEDWLAHWIAHELGHLVTNSTKEEDAERAAHEFRRRLKGPRKQEIQLEAAPLDHLKAGIDRGKPYQCR